MYKTSSLFFKIKFATNWLNRVFHIYQILLFLVYINNIPELVHYFCKLFTDDTKMISVKKNSTDQKTLQEDVDILMDWSRTWQMELKEDKCKVMDTGRSRLGRNVIVMDHKSGDRVEFEETFSERDGRRVKQHLY